MKKLSPDAIDLLRKMLAQEVTQQVIDGKGDEPMPTGWTELYYFGLELENA